MLDLFFHIKKNDYLKIDSLLNTDIDLSYTTEYAVNYLQALIIYSCDEIKTLNIITSHWGKIKFLVNHKDLTNSTALHYACLGNKQKIIRFILSYPDININSQDNSLSSPLHLLLSQKNSNLNFDIIDLFLTYPNHNIFLINGFKENIIHICFQHKIPDEIIFSIIEKYPKLITSHTLSNSNLFLYSAKYKRHSSFINKFIEFNISPFDLNDKEESAIQYFSKEDYIKLSQAEHEKIAKEISSYELEEEKIKRI